MQIKINIKNPSDSDSEEEPAFEDVQQICYNTQLLDILFSFIESGIQTDQDAHRTELNLNTPLQRPMSRQTAGTTILMPGPTDCAPIAPARPT